MLEFLIGLAVVLVAGGLIALNRDRIRSLGAALTAGVAAETLSSDLDGDSATDGQAPHHGHANEAHWDADDSTP